MSLSITPFDALGLVGSSLFVVAFAGMQTEKLNPHGLPALLMNFVGAILVLISLIYSFNLASFVLETVWGIVALYGLVKLGLKRRKD